MMNEFKRSRTLAAACALALSVGTAAASTIDFEDLAPGTYSSVTTGGVTFTFTAGSGLFDVGNASPGFPIANHNLISFFQNPGEGAFKATTPGGFSSFSIGCGDFNADDDDCRLEAYDSLGSLLASSSFFNLASTFGGGMMSVSSSTPIAYVLFYELGSFAGAVYWDSVEFTGAAAPEPASLALLGFGLAGLAAIRRRKQ